MSIYQRKAYMCLVQGPDLLLPNSPCMITDRIGDLKLLAERHKLRLFVLMSGKKITDDRRVYDTTSVLRMYTTVLPIDEQFTMILPWYCLKSVVTMFLPD